MFLAIQEAVTNVLKHSDATEARLIIRYSEQILTVVVEDFGRGFASDVSHKAGGGNGLKNIRSRLARVGGTAEIHATPRQGKALE